MKKCFDLLVKLSCEDKEHSNRSLLEHLVGTYNLLNDWHNDKYVCKAGLFHSIYGTKAFLNKSLDLAERNLLNEAIGHKAEELVFYMHYLTNEHLYNFTKAGISGHRQSLQFDSCNLYLTKRRHRDLVEISMANMVEQIPFIDRDYLDRNIKDVFNKWKWAEPYCSKHAFDSFKAVLSENILNSQRVH